MNRKYIIFLLVVSMTFQSSASLFGTFPQQLEKQTDDLDEEISIGVINTGESDLNLEFTSPESREYNISMPGDVVLEPSEISSNPEGEDWYYLGNGSYASYEIFSFPVEISEYRESNTVHVPLTVTATGEQVGTNPVTRLRDYNYTLQLNPRLRPLERDGDVQQGDLYWEDETSVPEEWTENRTENTSERSGSSESDTNRSEDYKQQQGEISDGEEEGVSLTLLLLAGIALTSLYIMKVI